VAQQLNGWGRGTWGQLGFGEGDLPVNLTAPAALTVGAPVAGVNAQAIASIPGLVGTLGSLSVLVDGEANVNLTGVSATSALGSISLVTNNNLSVVGFNMPAAVGSIVTDAEAVVTLEALTEMISGTTDVNVWGLVDESQSPSYTTVTDTQSPNWNEVAA
tara:strand:- start:366 stop:845 length:480 start_codon:yes stop_codon:yes gene_type:complete